MNSFARRPGLLQGPSRKTNPRDSWPAWTDRPVRLGPAAPALEARPPRPAALLATSRGEVLDLSDGPATSVLALVDLARVAYRVDWSRALAGGEDPEAFAVATPDQVVWADGRAVAVIRPRADGSLDVFRLAEAGPLAPAAEGGAR